MTSASSDFATPVNKIITCYIMMGIGAIGLIVCLCHHKDVPKTGLWACMMLMLTGFGGMLWQKSVLLQIASMLLRALTTVFKRDQTKVHASARTPRPPSSRLVHSPRRRVR